MTNVPPNPAPTKVTRQELYQAVWTTPMSHLAARYGISGNGLAKICARLNVPYPPRGHWAKVRAGKKSVKPRLPAADKSKPTEALIQPTPPTPTLSFEAQAAVDTATAAVGRVEVSSRLANPHPVIAKWLADRRRRIEDARSSPWRDKAFAPKPFSQEEQRRHRILDALFKELERHGAKISDDDGRSLHAEMEGEKIEFQLREKQKQVRRPPTAEESRWEWNRKRGFIQELQPTGYLVLAIKTYLGSGLRSEWRETAEVRMENLLHEVVAGFLAAAPFLAERTRKREEERRQHEAAERQRYELSQQRKLVRNRLRKFTSHAKAWQDIQLAQEFLVRVRAQVSDPTAPIGEKTALQWIEWLTSALTDADPLAHGVTPLLQEIAEVTSWTFND